MDLGLAVLCCVRYIQAFAQLYVPVHNPQARGTAVALATQKTRVGENDGGARRTLATVFGGGESSRAGP
jgi:hypothetical protein